MSPILSHLMDYHVLCISCSRGLQTLLSEGRISSYTTDWGPDILRIVIVSGYVTFCQTNKFFVNYFFMIDKMSSRAGWNGVASRMWPAGRSLETLSCLVGTQPVWGWCTTNRETFHSRSLNNINFHFKFAILIGKNECSHLLFCVLSFVKFCARKFLLSLVVSKVIVNYKVFSTKLYAHEMFGSREFRTLNFF